MLEISPLIFCIIAKAYPHGEKAHFERLMKVVAFGTSQSCHRNLIILKLDYFDHFKTIFSVNKRKLLNLERRSHISNGKDKLRQTIL